MASAPPSAAAAAAAASAAAASAVARRHVALLFRHGDRSPTFNSMEPLAKEAAEEAATWAWSLPPSTLRAELDARFPIRTAHERRRDDALGDVWGALTALGVLQMRKLGAVVSEKAAKAGEEIRVRRVSASNFKRTQYSAQVLLSGLTLPPGHDPIEVRVADERSDVLNVWGTDPDLRRLLRANGVAASDVSRNTPDEDKAKDVIVNAVPAFTYLLRPFSWISALDHTMAREGKTGGGGPLRGRTERKRIEELFRAMDTSNAGRLSRENLVHGLKTVSPFSSGVDVEKLVSLIDQNSDGGVDVSEFTSFIERLKLPNPSRTSEEAFWNAANVVERAVCRRVDSILGRVAVRRLTAGAFARHVASDLSEVQAALGLAAKKRAAASSGSGFPAPPPTSATTTSTSKSKPVVTLDVYSAHDITLVPLLRELGLWSGSQPWPGVASALALEFHSKPDGSDASVSFSYFSGVRGSRSGLEPRGMLLEPCKVRLSTTGDVGESLPLAKFLDFAGRL